MLSSSHCITLKPSLLARGFLLLTHLAALLALGVSSHQGWGLLPFVVLAFLAVVNLLLAWRALRRLNGLTFRLASDGGFAFRDQQGNWCEAQVLSDALVWPWLVAARIRRFDDGKILRLIALPDSLPKNEFRVLRVWMRHLARPDTVLQ